MKFLKTILFITMLLTVKDLLSATINVGVGGCTLKDAIRAANADAARGDCSAGNGADVIVTPDIWFVILNSTLPTINTDLTIRTQTVGGLLVIDGDAEYRVMKISGANTEVTLTRVKLRNGFRGTLLANGGAALHVTGATVTLNNCEILDNFVLAKNGAGIRIDNGELIINQSIIAGNILQFEDFTALKNGVGIYAKDSIVRINETTFFRNLHNRADVAGSSLYIEGGSLYLNNSIIDEVLEGILADDAVVEITNTTFSRSQINQTIYSRDLLYVRNNSQLKMNHLTFGDLGFVTNDASIEISNSILGRCSISNSSLVLNTSNLFLNDECIANSADNDIYLSVLTDNGGLTKTHAIAYQSSAVNTGDPNYCLNLDQRGVSRGTACDIGAYEVADQADVSIGIAPVTTMPYAAGQTVLLNLVVSNNGPGIASLVSLEALTQGMTITQIDSSICSNFPCVWPFVSPGSQITIPFYAQISSLVGTNFNLEFDVDETNNSLHHDPNLVNNHASISGNNIAGAELSIEKTLITQPPFFIGQSIKYNILVTNLGAQSANNVIVTEQPENLTITVMTGCSSVNANMCNINFINNAVSHLITVNATIDSAFFNNSASVIADEFDYDLSNNIDDQFNGGAVTDADLRVSMTLLTPSPHYSDQVVQYEVIIKSGDNPATNLVLDSEFDGIYIGIDGCQFLPCEFNSIAANSIIPLTFTMFATQMIPEITEEFTHTVTITAGQADPNLGNNTASITRSLVSAVNLEVGLNLVSSPPFYVGQTIEYSMRVRNLGLNNANNVAITIAPDNLEIIWAISQNCTSLDCIVPAMDFFQTEDVTISAKILSLGAFDMTANVSSPDLDPILSDNSDSTNNGGIALELPDDLIFEDGFE